MKGHLLVFVLMTLMVAFYVALNWGHASWTEINGQYPGMVSGQDLSLHILACYFLFVGITSLMFRKEIVASTRKAFSEWHWEVDDA